MADFAVEELREGIEPIPLPAAVAEAVIAEGPGLRARHRGRVARRAGVVLAIVLALTAASFTPPGRAATGWVSDLIAGPNTFEPGQYGYQLQTSSLIGSGELPTSDPYQLRAFVNANGRGKPVGCVVIVWQHSQRSLPECSNVPGWNGDRASAVVASRLPEDEDHPGAHGIVVLGAAPRESTEVRIAVPESPGVPASAETAQIFPVGGTITATDGASATVKPVQVFVGYLPPGAGDFRSAPPAQAVAFDGERQLDSTDLSWLRFVPPGGKTPFITDCIADDPLCQQMLEQDQGHRSP